MAYTVVFQPAEDLQTAWLIPDAHHYNSLIDAAVYVMSCFSYVLVTLWSTCIQLCACLLGTVRNECICIQYF